MRDEHPARSDDARRCQRDRRQQNRRPPPLRGDTVFHVATATAKLTPPLRGSNAGAARRDAGRWGRRTACGVALSREQRVPTDRSEYRATAVARIRLVGPAEMPCAFDIRRLNNTMRFLLNIAGRKSINRSRLHSPYGLSCDHHSCTTRTGGEVLHPSASLTMNSARFWTGVRRVLDGWKAGGESQIHLTTRP